MITLDKWIAEKFKEQNKESETEPQRFIRCYDCGELKLAKLRIREGSKFVLYTCECKECGSITTSNRVDYIK
ncbi:MAG: hypothetical protein ACRCX8_08750 [Sarcina sp.]